MKVCETFLSLILSFLSFLSFSAEFDARYGREAGLGLTNYREYLEAIGEDYDEIMAEVDPERRREREEAERKRRQEEEEEEN